MLRRRMLLALTAAVVAGTCWLGQALSQQDPPAPGNGARPGRGGARMTPEEMRKRMQDRMRERLGATEEEMKVLGPKIEKVSTLQRAGRGGFGGGMAARGGGRRGGTPGATPAPGAPAREQSDVQKKTEALQSLLDDQASSSSAIKAALDALRAAREKAAQELEAARKDLRAVVTVRQEAALVLMSVLD